MNPPVAFTLDASIPILRRTPSVLRELLVDLPEQWTHANEGPDTWSAFDVVGHLIHGERTDWIPRVEHILRHGDSIPFTPFDMTAMFQASKGLSVAELLETFAELRALNVDRLIELRLTDDDLSKRGRHPELGPVTMRQHLATWVAHDLSHICQISRVMAKQYGHEMGPWRAYFSLLRDEAVYRNATAS